MWPSCILTQRWSSTLSLILLIVTVLYVQQSSAKTARTLFDIEEPKEKKDDGKDPKQAAAERLAALREYRIKERDRRAKLPKPPPRDFSSPRIENIWNAAKSKYSNKTEADTLKKIKEELTEISTIEKTLRKKDNLSEDAPEVTQLREKLKNFFDKYEKLHPRPFKLTPHNDSVLEDPTLKEYWSRVKHLEFLEERDIQELQGEFMYCQDQIMAMNHFLDNDAAFAQLHEVGHDAITKVFKQGEEAVEKFMEQYYEPHGKNESRRALFIYSQLGKEVASCYDRLHHYTERDIRKGGFKEPLVNKLWKEAQSANFTHQEMELFKSELEAFQGKLKKQENLLRHSQEVERRYTHRFQTDDQLHPGMKMDMARQVQKMREENKSRREEVANLYKNLTAKLFSTIPEHLPDEL